MEAVSSKESLGLPLAVWGSGYAEFLPRWWSGVQSLQRQPDQIVIVTDEANFAKAKESVPEGYSPTIKQVTASTYAEFWNLAILGLSTDWVAICNVDDLFLPEALNDIENAEREGCNLITDSIQDLQGGQIHKSTWNGGSVGTHWSMVGAEPMKRDLFARAGGFPNGYRFADWALAMRMHLVGVKAYDSQIVRIIYDRGLTRKTVSSILNPQSELHEGYVRLAKLAKQLGLT